LFNINTKIIPKIQQSILNLACEAPNQKWGYAD